MSNSAGLLSRIDVYRPIPHVVSPQIDSLRGLSAIVVLLAHANQVFISPSYHGLYAIFGVIAQSAVMVFFVLSGFLIGKSLTRNASSENGFNLVRYATDRANRIFPPLVFSIIVVLILYFAAPYTFSTGTNSFIDASQFMARQGFNVDATSIVGSLFFLNGFLTENISVNGPLWSLSFEVWYYIAAGAIFFYRGPKRVIVFAAIMCLLGALNKLFIFYSVVWFSGLAVCILDNNKIFYKKLSIIICAAFGLPAIALAAYYTYSFIGNTSPNQTDIKLIFVFNFLFGISASAALHMLVNGLIKIKPILPRTSAFSYTLYVIHFPIILFVYGTTQTLILNNTLFSFVVAAISAAFCILLARLVARHIETAKPFSALKAPKVSPI